MRPDQSGTSKQATTKGGLNGRFSLRRITEKPTGFFIRHCKKFIAFAIACFRNETTLLNCILMGGKIRQ
jgi:hypothetical protein